MGDRFVGKLGRTCKMYNYGSMGVFNAVPLERAECSQLLSCSDFGVRVVEDHAQHLLYLDINTL